MTAGTVASGGQADRAVADPLRDAVPDFARAPFVVFWEVTRACALACVHCRADAGRGRAPGELTVAEAERLFRDLRNVGTRLLVLTGGDPLERPDLVELIRRARALGLTPALSPSATPRLTPAVVTEVVAAGVGAISLSLDGADAASHDRFRGVPGAFARTCEAAAAVRASGAELRINTTVTRANLASLPALADLAATLGARTWVPFFLVPTGRASQTLQISASECEAALRWCFERSATAPFRLKTTEAPHYRRVVLQGLADAGRATPADVVARSRSGGGRFLPGINDARGVAFVSHVGEVYPSGFLPLSAGNIRRRPLSACYTEDAWFRRLRDPDALHGRCGRCAFRALCGGSRARAYAATGDPLGEDPLCAFDPPLP